MVYFYISKKMLSRIKPFGITAIFILFSFPLFAQQNNVCSINQWLNVKAYQGKQFRFSVDFKNEGLGHVSISVSTKHQRPTSNRFWRSKKWKRGQFDGQFLPDADSVNLEVLFNYGNQFYVDNARFEVEISPGKWKALPLVNPGFEEWTKDGKLKGWGKRIYFFENYLAEEETEGISEGNSALEVRAVTPQVSEYHQIKTTVSNLQFKPVDHLAGRVLFQDSRGFIWLFTTNGLVRFDGLEKKTYSHLEEDSLSLSSNYLMSIFEDRSSALWLGTPSGGINHFNPSTEFFHTYQHNPDNPQSLSDNMVGSSFEDPSGKIWVATRSGLNLLEPETGNSQRFSNDLDDPFSTIAHSPRSMISDTTGRMWFLHFAGLQMFNKEKQQFDKYMYLGDPDFGIQSNFVMDKEGSFWGLSDKGHLLRFNPYQRKFTAKFRLEGNSMGGGYITMDTHDNIWMKVNGEDGRRIGCFNTSSQQFTIYLGEEDPPRAGSLRQFTPKLMVDREGAIWATGSSQRSLARQEIYRLNPRDGQFTGAADSRHLFRWNIKEDIHQVLEDSRGWIWYSVKKKGIFCIHPKSGQRDSFPNLVGRAGWHNGGLYEMSDGNIWVSFTQWSKGPAIINPITRSVKPIDASGRLAVGFLPLGDTTYWVHLTQIPGEKGALAIYHKGSGTLEALPVQHEGDNDYFGASGINTIHQDKDGGIWLGMRSGLLKRYMPETGLFEVYNPNSQLGFSTFSERAVISIYEDPQGYFWLGTSGAGLIRYDYRQKTTQYYGRNKGFSGAGIRAMIPDAKGNLWLATSGGITKFDPVSESYTHYTTLNGLPSNNISSGTLSKQSGQLIFGTDQGFIAFHPDSLKINELPPPIVITSLSRINRDRMEEGPIPVPGIDVKKSIKLSYKDDILNFNFAALSYSNSAQNQYAFRLKGLNDEWVPLGTKRELTFTNLAPGNYTLGIKGANSDGVWNEQGTELKIIITPPWYWSPLSKGIYLLLFGLSIVLFFNWRTRNLRRQKKQLEQTVKERTEELEKQKTRAEQSERYKEQFLANMSHEIRTPMHAILGMTNILVRNDHPPHQDKYLQAVQQNSDHLMRILNDILDLSKMEAGKIEVESIPMDLPLVLENVMALLRLKAEEKGLRFQLQQGDQIPQYLYGDPTRLSQILLNLLGNAIKFTEKGQVSLSVTQRDDQVLFAVADTGIGIPRDKLAGIFGSFEQVDTFITKNYGGTGLGLSISKQLVELQNGEIWAESTEQGGTTFYVALPFLPVKDVFIPKPVIQQEQINEMGQALKNTRILIAEDNEFNVMLVCDDLSYYIPDVNIDVAKNGREVVEAYQKGDYDVILMDVQMPELSGYEATQRIRGYEGVKAAKQGTPIIAMTASLLKSEIDLCYQAGMDNYIPKPYKIHELIGTLYLTLN